MKTQRLQSPVSQPFSYRIHHRAFSLNFWWGTQNFRSLLGTNGDEVGWVGLAKKSEWSQNCPPNANLGHFCYFKHEIQLFKVLLSLKVVKFDSKMYLNFSNFWGQTSAGGEQALVQNGDKYRMGGWQHFCWMGDPQSPPPRKKTLHQIPLWFKEAWGHTSLNHNEICHILFENA